MWVNGTIKYVFTNEGPQGKEQTYKALFDGDKTLTKTWHSHIEAEPKETDSGSSDSDDTSTLKDLGVGSETDDTDVPEQTVVPEGDKYRRTSTRKTISNSKPPNSQKNITNKPGPPKDKPIAKKKTAQMPKKPAATKDKLNPQKKSAAPKDPPEIPLDEDDTTNGTCPHNHPFAMSVELSVELSFVSLIAIVLHVCQRACTHTYMPVYVHRNAFIFFPLFACCSQNKTHAP